MTREFTYVRPRTLREASDHLGDGALVHAGGTDLLGCMHDGVLSPDRVVSLADVPDLAGIRADGGGLRIGPMTRIADLASHPAVSRDFAVLSQAAAAVASPQLRNQGTAGGNLLQKPRCPYYRGDFDCLRKGGGTCFAAQGEHSHHAVLGGGPCWALHPSDTAPALIALDATVVLRARRSREVPVEELHVLPSEDATRETVLEPDEVLAEIRVPAPPGELVSRYAKVRGRRAWDFALASVALAVVLDDGVVRHARVVLGGLGTVPWRATGAEEALVGKALGAEVAREAGGAAVEGARAMEENGWKVELGRRLVEREIGGLMG